MPRPQWERGAGAGIWAGAGRCEVHASVAPIYVGESLAGAATRTDRPAGGAGFELACERAESERWGSRLPSGHRAAPAPTRRADTPARRS